MARRAPHLREPHGTDARARRHRRDGEKPCPACLDAERQATRRRQLASGYLTGRTRSEAQQERRARELQARAL
jgi:hypothetical protein